MTMVVIDATRFSLHGVRRLAQLHPAGGELIQIESLAVKQMQEAVVSFGTQPKNTDTSTVEVRA